MTKLYSLAVDAVSVPVVNAFVPLPPALLVTGGAREVESTTWTVLTSGNFNTAANWANGLVPGSGVDALIAENSNDSITVTLSSGVSDIADSLTTGYAGLLLSNATLTLQGVTQGSSLSAGTSTALTENGGLLDFQNGPSENRLSTISSSGAAVDQTAGIIEVDAGFVDITGNSVFDGTLTGSGDKPDSGTVSLLGSSTYSFGSKAVISVGLLDLSGPGANMILAGSLKLDGGFETSGDTTIDMGSTTLLQLDDSATANDVLGGTVIGGTVLNEAISVLNGAVLDSNTTLTNGGTLLLNGGGGTVLTLDATGTALPLLNNGSGHVVDVLNGAYEIIGGSITNAGSIVLGTSADLTVTSLLTSSGSISVAAGDLLEINNNFTVSGRISGAGTLQTNFGGSDTISAGSTLSVADFVFNPGSGDGTLTIDTTAITSSQLWFEEGGVVNFGTSLSYAGTFNATDGFGSLDLDIGSTTLTLSGSTIFDPTNFNSETVVGTGTLALLGSTLIEEGGLIVGNGAALNNSGKLTELANLQIGSISGPATVTNGGKGVWNLQAGAVGSSGSNVPSTFTNLGLFETTSASSVPQIDADFVSSGTISIAAGYETDFYGGVVNSGAISGAGTIGLRGSSSNTLASGSVVSIGQINLEDSATLTLGENLTYAGLFNDGGGGGFSAVVDLGGDTLTLTGKSTFQATELDGPGSIVVSGTGTVSNVSDGLEIGGGARFVNSGTLVQNEVVQIGDSGGDTSSVTNSATGTWSLANANGLRTGTNASSSFTNAGLVQNTGSSNDVTIGVVFDSTGTLSVLNAGSAIALTDGGSIGGTLAGSGEIDFSGGVFTLASSVALKTATIGIYGNGTSVTLAGSASSAGTLALGDGASLTLGGASSELTVSGQGTLAGEVLGAGTLAVASGATVVTDAPGLGSLTLGGSAVLLDSGVMAQSLALTIGNGDASTAALQIAAGAIYEITGDATLNSNGLGSISNAGTFEMLQGTGTTTVTPLFTNTGSVLSNSGTLDFNSAVTNDGTITADNGNTVMFASSVTTTGSASGTIVLTGGGFATLGGFVGSAETLSFSDATGSIATLSTPGSFEGTISGFGGSNEVHLRDFESATGSYANGVLSLTGENTQGTLTSAALHFAGSYATGNFDLTSDHSTGTFITFLAS